MADKDVIKALECCTHSEWCDKCDECFYCECDSDKGCRQELIEDTFALINRQQSAIDVYMQENDKLKTLYIQVSEDRNEIRKEVEAEIEAWKKINQRLYDEMEERRKEDIGIAKG